jgi:hypothetical protein
VGRVPFIKNNVEMKSNTNDSVLLIFDNKIRQPKIKYVKRDDIKAQPRKPQGEG